MFLAIRRLLKLLVAREESNRRRRPFQGRLPNRGSGLKSTDVTKVQELKSSLFQADSGSFGLFAALRCSRIVRESRVYKLRTNQSGRRVSHPPNASSGPISGF
jgi:hypothetical protein